MKKTYTSPRLAVYGDVHVITQTRRGGYDLSCPPGNNDGPKGWDKKQNRRGRR